MASLRADRSKQVLVDLPSALSGGGVTIIVIIITVIIRLTGKVVYCIIQLLTSSVKINLSEVKK